MDRYGAIAQHEPVTGTSTGWQHLVVEIVSDGNGHQGSLLQDRLDRMGQEGWELVALTSRPHREAAGGMTIGGRPSLLAIFKRPRSGWVD